MYLSILRNYIHAVGGELWIQAVFPDGGTVVIDRFGKIRRTPIMLSRALHVPEVQIASIKTGLETTAGPIEICGRGSSMQRIFSVQDLAAAGFKRPRPNKPKLPALLGRRAAEFLGRLVELLGRARWLVRGAHNSPEATRTSTKLERLFGPNGLH